MPSYPKRLIEVDLPIRRISAHARREKSIRHGHISTLHIWWARRPLAACRAVICAALWPDPVDERCPQAFRDAAAGALVAFAARARESAELGALVRESWTRWNRTTAVSLKPGNPGHWGELRYALLDFIADFANWDASANPAFLETARALTAAAHEALGGAKNSRPLVADPFAGGGSIPLEALRAGADAFAGDLNPVAVLLNKVVLEYIPRHGARLAEEVRRWGTWIRERAAEELAAFYPNDPDGAVPIAYLWARTVRCEGPGCGAEVPLMRSMWLAKKPKRSFALRILPDKANKRVEFEILENPKPAEVGGGTVARGSATCPCCDYTTPVASVRRQLKERRGGAADARLFCAVTTHPGRQGRFYRLPTEGDLQAARNAAAELEARRAAHASAHPGEPSLVPDEPLPPQGTLGFRVQLYGMEAWGDLFTPRQALALTTLVRLVREAGDEIAREYDAGLAEAVGACLAIAISRMSDRACSLCTWRPQADQEKVEHVFTRQALPMTWDFAEGTPVTVGTAGWEDAYEPPAQLVDTLAKIGAESLGQAVRCTATQSPHVGDSIDAFITDPPYYDAVPYADLSDFFGVWLRRTLPPALRDDLFTGPLAPKEEECIVDEVKGKDNAYFVRTMGEAMAEGRRVLRPDGIGVVVFAHKSTSGWEAQLAAMIDAGWTITGSWPIDTEMGSRLRAMNSAALASSVHLVCRPREEADGSVTTTVGEWRAVLAELPVRTREWMRRLADEGVAGADAIFACLGPALEIFSRYARVEKASGERVPLGEYLEQVWAAVAREALAAIFAEADAAGFEADARLTAIWLWTLAAGEPTAEGAEGTEEEEEEAPTGNAVRGGFELEYDTARKIAQGLGADLAALATLVETRGERARLLPVAERARRLFETPASAQTAPADRPKRGRARQTSIFEELGAPPEPGAEEGGAEMPLRAAETVLDRVHQAMLLFAAGRGDALRRFLVEDAGAGTGAGRDQRFWSLAQALSALYPAATPEKRWVDGVLARKKGLGM